MTLRILVAALLLTTSLSVLVPEAHAAGTVRLVAFGDTGVGTAAKSNVQGAISDGVNAGFIGLGDYEYWDPVSTWESVFRPLTDQDAYLALGNHDDRYGHSEHFTHGTTWSRSVNGVRIVGINTESRMDVGSSQYNTVRGALCGAPEATRILVMHKAWWLLSGARHPGWEFPGSASAMDQMVKDCGVDLVLAGHEHNYQRMVRNGVSYAIVGTGGQSTYPVAGSPSGTVSSYVGFGRLLLDVSADGISARFVSLDGRQRDAFTAGGGTTTPPPPPPEGTPALTFASSGNEWWAQAKVGGADASLVSAVQSRDTNGAWVSLTWRSWGAWAGSYHVEPGHQVQYRATLRDGRSMESCWFAHPGGAVAQCPTSPVQPTGFKATFSNARGNTWWVESDVAGSGGTLAGVEARVNGGTWVPLSKTSWGSWAKSFFASGTVEFRARASDGQLVTSAPYAWPPR